MCQDALANGLAAVFGGCLRALGRTILSFGSQLRQPKHDFSHWAFWVCELRIAGFSLANSHKNTQRWDFNFDWAKGISPTWNVYWTLVDLLLSKIWPYGWTSRHDWRRNVRIFGKQITRDRANIAAHPTVRIPFKWMNSTGKSTVWIHLIPFCRLVNHWLTIG